MAFKFQGSSLAFALLFVGKCGVLVPNWSTMNIKFFLETLRSIPVQAILMTFILFPDTRLATLLLIRI